MAKNLYKAFKTDRGLEADTGIALDFGDGTKVFVHRAGGANQAFIDLMAARTKPLQTQIRAGTLDNGAATRVLAEVYAESVIKGWEGVTDEAGEPLEFSKANCVKVLLDLPEFFNHIQAEASRIGNFQKMAVAADVEATKNA